MAKIKITISAENAQAIAALKQVASAAVQAGGSVETAGKSGASSLKQASASATSLSQTLANVTITAGGVIMALKKVKDTASALIKPGIDFAKQAEISKLGIAGVLMSMTKLNNETLKLNDALAISGNAIDDLAQSSGEIGLPLNELTETFQAIVGAGLTQKMAMKEIVDFTITGTKAVKTMMVGVGNEGMQVIQELRSMISGDINQNSQVARSLGITSADIEKAKQSAGGLFKYLQDKLSGFAEIVKVYPDTLKGKIDRLTTAFQQVSAKGTEPFTDLLKQGLDAITDQLLVTETIVTETGKTLKTVKLNPELIDDMKSASTYIARLARDGANFAVTMAKLASGPASVVLSIIKLILDHAAQVTFTILAWMAIGRLPPILAGIILQLQYQLSVFRMLVATSGTFQATLIATGTVVKSLLVTTGWGILAVAIGYAADQAFKLYENLNKAGKARRDYFKEKENSMRPIPEQLEDKLGQPVYSVNPDVNMGGMNQQAILKLEKFIAAINYMFPDRAVTVTSGYREWGGHVSRDKADIAVEGMDDPFFRQQIISLGKEFGIAILDEVKGPASNTPEARKNWGPHLDLDMSGKGLSSPGAGTLELKNPKDDAEALAKAKIALAEAISNQTLQAYISDLQRQQTQLEQRRQATEGGFTSVELPAISQNEYIRQTALSTRQIAEAEIAKLEEERRHLEELAKNNNLSNVESPINLQAQIVQKNTEIATARSKLVQSLQQLGFEDAKAQKELMDLMSDLEIQLLEERGRTAEAAKLKADREKKPLLTRLQAEGKTTAVDTANNLYNLRQAKADYAQAQTNLEIANEEMVTVQINLLNDLAAGTKSTAQVSDEYVQQYNAKMQDILAGLRLQLDVAIKLGDRDLANKIRAAIRGISDKLSEFFDVVIQRIDANLQHEIAMINADPSLTRLQRQDKIDAANRKAAGDRAAEYEQQAKELRDADKREGGNKHADKIRDLEKSAALNRELEKTPSLLEKIGNAAKQGLEDGLLSFLSEGINRCRSLGEALRSMAMSIVQSIQQIYAQELTKKIMVGIGLGPVQENAEGGEIKGPGTGTSDSILSWLSNGEFVVKAESVRKYGTRFLHNLNAGIVPRGMLPAFATGGLVGASNVPDGPPDVSVLAGNNETLLKIINLQDPNMVYQHMGSRRGEKVVLNTIQQNAETIRRILK